MTYVGSANPRMLLVGEAWGQDEAILKEPFVGASGQELWRMLGEAMPDIAPELHSSAAEWCSPRYGLTWTSRRHPWLSEARIGFSNVLNMRPPGNQLEALCYTKAECPANYPHPRLVPSAKGYLKEEHLHHVTRLRKEVETFKPNLVVAMGNAACWALLNTTGITAIRGTTTWSPWGVKVLPTIHPAAILRDWSSRPIVIADLMKANREADFPEIRRPKRSIIINPSFEDVQTWIEETILLAFANEMDSLPQLHLSVDVETTQGMIDTIGFSRSKSDALVIPFGPHRYRRGAGYVYEFPHRDGREVKSYWTEEEERKVWRLIRRLLELPIPTVFQNGTYDLQYLWRMGIRVGNVADDTMLAWHALYAELPKSLGFIGSVLTDEAAWKQLSKLRSDTVKRDE